MIDIDMQNIPFTGIKEFAGKLDGNGKYIYDLNIDNNTAENIGFIGQTNGNVTIRNSSNQVTVAGDRNDYNYNRVGGLVGKDKGFATITNSSNTGDIKSEAYNFSSVCGFVGFADPNALLTIDNSSNTSKIIATSHDPSYVSSVGGFIGNGSGGQ